ncbi:hypothetical protein IAU60_002016 [Kwoniella sp. DSM 27419]
MPLREADIAAPSIDDGSFDPTDQGAPSTSTSTDPNSPRNRPMSPMPKLVLFDSRSGQQEVIELGSASSILTMEDYKRLNRRTTERGMFTGLLGGGLLTYALKRLVPKTRALSRNALTLTFIFSSAFISYSTSRGLLISEILKVRAQARAKAIANGDLPDGSGPDSFPDSTPGFGTSPSELRSPEREAQRGSPSPFTPPGYGRNDDRDRQASPGRESHAQGMPVPVPGSASGSGPGAGQAQAQTQARGQRPEGGYAGGNVRDELARLGQPRERTRWAKGKGLEGEVEEENEMRDPYATPGQPRLG